MAGERVIQVYTDEKTLTLDVNGKVIPKLSQEDGNGIYLGEDGYLHLQKGSTPGSSSTDEELYNIPGNGIADTDEGEPIEILRCHKTVTRMEQKPNDIKVPVLVDDIVTGILNWSDE